MPFPRRPATSLNGRLETTPLARLRKWDRLAVVRTQFKRVTFCSSHSYLAYSGTRLAPLGHRTMELAVPLAVICATPSLYTGERAEA